MLQPQSLAPGLLLRMLRAHITSPYVLLWRTVEVAVLAGLAARHGIDLRHSVDLDVGCGNGVLGSALCDQIDLGFDLSRPALHWARQHKPVYRSLVCASATNIPLGDGSRNLVFSNSVIEHIPDGEAALDELARVVAPGGYLLLSTVNAHFPRLVLGREPDSIAQAAVDESYAHHHYYTPARFREALQARGLVALQHASYITARQARLMHRLRSWESQHPQRGPARRLAQLARLPIALLLLPAMTPFITEDDQGAGLAIVAMRPFG